MCGQSIELIFMDGVMCSQSIELIFMGGVACILQIFNIVTSGLYLTYFIPQGDLCMVYYAHKFEVTITKKVFMELCCPKIYLK